MLLSKRKNNRNDDNAKNFYWYKFIFKFFVIAILLITCCVVSVFVYFSRDLPDFAKLKTQLRTPAITIVDKNNNLIATYGDLYGEVLNINQLPKYVYNAFIAIEDRRFFNHFGIDIFGTIRALYKNLSQRGVSQGGSTITQQLAKNILIAEGMNKYTDRSIGRKIREAIMAIYMETKFTKAEIMTMYLNRSYFGSGAYGIDAAAKKFFNKSARQLTIFEAAILAGSLKSPSHYNIMANRDTAFNRAMVVLKNMEEQGMIDDCNRIYRESVDTFEEQTSINKKNGNNVMYFADYAYRQACNILGSIDRDVIIVTTIDNDVQQLMEEAVRYYYETKADEFKFQQIASACYDRDGSVLAMVGGVNYIKSQFNRAYQAKRLIGSVCKIFVYGAALSCGYQFGDMLSDVPPEIDEWKPRNYGWTSRGEVSFLWGFRYSINAVSIRLTQEIGIQKVADFAKLFGINLNRHDLTIALGTTESNVCDILAAYTAFMDGVYIKPYAVEKIIDAANGDILYSRAGRLKTKILDDELLKSCRYLLRDVIQNGTGKFFNANEYTYGKTGTNGSCDTWFFGFYDPPEMPCNGLSIGVWVGNDNMKDSMKPGSVGGKIPTYIARRFLDSVIANQERKTINNQLLEMAKNINQIDDNGAGCINASNVVTDDHMNA